MSRYDLPERGSTAVWERNEGFKVIKAYQRGDLKSRDEMDIEAAAAVLQGDDGFGPIDVSSWQAWAETILDAAFGEVADE